MSLLLPRPSCSRLAARVYEVLDVIGYDSVVVPKGDEKSRSPHLLAQLKSVSCTAGHYPSQVVRAAPYAIHHYEANRAACVNGLDKPGIK